MPELLVSLLLSDDAASRSARDDITRHISPIMHILHTAQATRAPLQAWVHETVKSVYANEIIALTQIKPGFHFNARQATEQQLAGFDLEKLSDTMLTTAPHLCDLLSNLLDANPALKHRRERQRPKRRARRTRAGLSSNPWQSMEDVGEYDADMAETETRPREAAQNAGANDAVASDSDHEFWAAFSKPDPALVGDYDDVEMDGDRRSEEVRGAAAEGEDSEDEYWDNEFNAFLPEDTEDPESEKDEFSMNESRKRVLTMRCNALQGVIGIFLHACNAPESIIELLSRIGVSISQTAIRDAITSLSKESAVALKQLGRTLLAGFAFDNFDIEIKQATPTIEKPYDALLHLTSGTLLRLDHGVSLNDLQCSDALWQQSPNNPANFKLNSAIDWTEFVNLHPDEPDAIGFTRRQRFHCWKFLYDLVHHGPEYFRRFTGVLGDAETVEEIPCVQSKQVPARAMDINQSTVKGNADALSNLFAQGGIGDPMDTPGCRDIGDHIILVHGDLATCERVQSVQRSRGEEKTPFNRYQSVVFVMGLFHLKMACADAIWKIFIQPKAAQEDDTSLLRQVREIRIKESAKVASKPGFRRMHEVIQHVGIVSRLDCWAQEVGDENRAMDSLEAWAQSRPSWDDLVSVATRLVTKYVAGPEFSELQYQSPEVRDQQWENTLLREQYFLLYEEVSYAMNAGDIGRVEDCFLPWIFIFRGCGKHKRAIRMNILCNPTGQKNTFRAIDWWVEHNNLYIKVCNLKYAAFIL
ncbi:hypothetical protein IEO21_03526 [Rhodonia placenta]|uniref:DUF6589 domain-containing protein n=1 Tax=Rhodonia placenta TaxID=104341 RepID=A0A8H7U3V8_9APHY|nr:hypothetical protein IEO21_03526 [Postia placenta]